MRLNFAGFGMFLPCLLFVFEINRFEILVKLTDMELLWYVYISIHFNILVLRSTFWFDSPSIFRRFTACPLAYFLHFSSQSSVTWGFSPCARHLEWNIGGLALYLLISGACLTISQDTVIDHTVSCSRLVVGNPENPLLLVEHHSCVEFASLETLFSSGCIPTVTPSQPCLSTADGACLFLGFRIRIESSLSIFASDFLRTL